MMSCQIKRDSNNDITAVYAPNGKPSKLYNNIKALVGNDAEKALSIWARAYSPSFIYRHGNWLSEEQDENSGIATTQPWDSIINLEKDENGEPAVKYLSIPEVSYADNAGTEKKVETFLSAIGVRLEYVEDILPKDITAKADFLNRIIHISKQKKDLTTLPEEAAHFFVRLLPEKSSLKNELFNQITSYPIYKTTLDTYSTVYTINGKPDFNKIKEEAIGKLIAAAVVDPSTVHTQEKMITKAKSWSSRILDFVRNLFGSQQNPFIQSAESILESRIEGLSPFSEIREDGIMYQLSSKFSAEQVFTLLSDKSRLIKKVKTSEKDPETGKLKEAYYYDDRQIKSRVTDMVKSYYNKIFGSRIEKSNREYFNLLAEQGSNIHEAIEDIMKRYLSSSGKLLSIASQNPGKVNVNTEIYALLEEHIVNRLTAIVAKYGDDTRFIAELMVADNKKDIAGTIDLLVIKPNGRVDILDWKSMNIITKNFSEIPWYKQQAYTIQLDQYEQILHSNDIQVDQKRAIPIRTIYGKNETDGKYNILSAIEVGDYNISAITEEKSYLLPVPSRSEKTQIEVIDDLIAKLQALEEQISKQKVSATEKFGKIEQLNNIRKSINSLLVTHSLDGVIHTGQILLSNIEKAMSSNTLDITSAQLFFKQIKIYSDLSKTIDALEAENLEKKISEENKSGVYRLSGAASGFENKLKKFIQDRGNEVAAKVGVDPVTTAEKNPSWWAANIRSISGTATNAVRTFYKYLVSFQDKIYQQRDENNAQLQILKKKLEKWAQTKNIPASKIFDGILEFDDKGRWKGTFLHKYNPILWKLKDQFIAEKNYEKIISLLDLSDPVKQRFLERQQSFLKWAGNNTFSLDESRDKKIREKKIDDWNSQYNVFDEKYQKIALLNPRNGIPGNPAYFSDKWKALQKEAPLLEAYNYFQSLLQKGEKLGIIEHQGHFIPNVAADKIDMWFQYGSQSIFNLPSFFESFEYKSGSTWGEIDPLTGKPLQTVPRLFMNNLSSQKQDPETGQQYLDYSMKSKDLFTIFSLWGKYVAEYEYTTSLEEVGDLMTITETIKDQHLHRGADGKYMPVKGNEENINYLQDFINYYVYGRKLKDNNPWEIELFGKHYSGKKMVQGAMRYMGMKTLAFNTISIAANYIGGKFNSFFSATKGQFFDKKQWAHAEYALATDKGKALVDWFDVFLEDTSYHKAKQLSVFGAVKKLSYDNLFIGQRISDKLVQYPVLLAMTQSYGVIDGEIVNLKQHLRKKHGYDEIYSKSVTDQKAVNAKINTELKLLEQNNSIWALARIVNGSLEIPGLSREMETVMQFRQKVKRANKIILGNSTTDDISRYRMTLLGQALGQFRNWIPAMADERFGELRYDADSEAWTTGKLRSFYSNYFQADERNEAIGKMALNILTKHFGVLLKDLVGLTSVSDIQSRAKLLYAKAKVTALDKGLPFEMKESEFIEMHLNNVRSTLAEMRLIITFTSLVFSMSNTDHDDDRSKGLSRFITRTLDKFNNELMFYYNPINFTDLINSPIPVVGLSTDIFKFMGHLAGEGYGRAIGDDKLIKKYKPTKYILKDIPISRELYNLGTIFNDDMRKAYEVTN